jgi:hypothetical protein
MKNWNIINLVPLNPNVTLAEKDGLKRPLFQNDDLLLTTVTSKKFQDLLLTDLTKQEGQDIIAEHFDITDKWTKVKRLGQEKSDATEKKRKSAKDLKETTPPQKRGQGK